MSFLTLSAQTYPNTALGYKNLSRINADLGVNNAVLGIFAADGLVTGVENVAIGLEALGVGAGASFNVAIGSVALRSANTNNNVAIGYNALSLPSYTGSKNTAIGQQSGSSMTSGSSNVIIGSFTGVGGSLDIRTLSNYIVLSDGDGNPRLWIDNTGAASIPGGIVWSGGTANGVLYLNASKVVTTNASFNYNGSALTASGADFLLSTNYAVRWGGVSDIYGDTSASLVFRTNSLVEQMRLNSTGLGIGRSPSYKLDVAGSARLNNGEFLYFNNSTGTAKTVLGYFIDNNTYLDASDGNIVFRTGTGPQERMRLDASGNLGLGVVPSSQFTSYRAINLGSGTNNYFAISGNGNATCEGNLTWNARSTAVETFAYLFTGDNATRYRQQYDFKWYLAPGGTAGNTISFTQAMTLDSSGRLLLGTTSATGASMDIQATSTGTAQLLNIQNLSSGASAVSRFTLGSQGGNWHIDNERTGAPLKFTFNSTLFFQINSSGSVVVGNAALTTTATEGFIYVPSCAGPPTGVPTTYTGRVPHVVDTTNKHAYWYIAGAWWRANLV